MVWYGRSGSCGQTCHFALAICKIVLERELSQKEYLKALVELLLVKSRSFTEKQQVEVFLSPEDYALIKDQLTDIKYDEKWVTGIEFFDDPELLAKEVKIETTLGLMKFDIARHLDDIEKEILAKHEEEKKQLELNQESASMQQDETASSDETPLDNESS